ILHSRHSRRDPDPSLPSSIDNATYETSQLVGSRTHQTSTKHSGRKTDTSNPNENKAHGYGGNPINSGARTRTVSRLRQQPVSPGPRQSDILKTPSRDQYLDWSDTRRNLLLDNLRSSARQAQA